MHIWAEHIQDPWVLRTISHRHLWRVVRTPGPRFHATSSRKSAEGRTVLRDYVKTLVLQGSIVLVPAEGQGLGVYSPLFVVQKKSAGFRPIIDLRVLNWCILKERFKVESL